MARLWVARMNDAPNLPSSTEHGLVIHAGHGLHLVHHHQRAPDVLGKGHAALLPDHRVHQVEQRRAHQGRHVSSHGPLGGGDQQHAALQDGLPQVDGGAGLAQDGPRPLGRRVVGQPGLHRGQGLGPVLAVPAPEVPGPPLQDVGVAHLRQHRVAEGFVGQQLQPVQDGVLLVRLHPFVGLVQGLDRLLQDGLHPRSPLLPQAPCNPHHRVGGAVPVGEDAGVQQVDAWRAGLVAQVYQAYLVDEGLRDLFQDSGHQVGVGVHDDDGVVVAALGLFTQLVADDVVHQGGLAHAGAGHVEVVTPEQVLGKPDGMAGPRPWCRPPAPRR